MDKTEALWAIEFRNGQRYERERILELLQDPQVSREELIQELNPEDEADWR
jgi:hypothetical protein